MAQCTFFSAAWPSAAVLPKAPASSRTPSWQIRDDSLVTALSPAASQARKKAQSAVA